MATKLSNNIEYTNPHFSAAFAEYLLTNGFSCTSTKDSIYFTKDAKQLVIRQDTVDLFIYAPEDPGQETEKWVFEQSHTGISHFNLFDWIFFLQLMKVLSIKEFARNVSKLEPQEAQEAGLILRTIIHSPLIQIK